MALKKIIILSLLIFVLHNANAQPGFGAPAYIQNFGKGSPDPSLIGTPLPSSKTEYSFSSSLCPPEGSYTIARRINVDGCFADEWIPLSKDNTSISEFGMMMIVNSGTILTNKVVYQDTVVNNMCPGTVYNFSVAIINIDRPSSCLFGPDFPVFEYRLEDDAGNIIGKDTTRPYVGYAIPNFDYKFTKYGFDFTMPSGINRMVVRLTLLRRTYSCAEDFAIDDIKIATVGPVVTSFFNNEPPSTTVKSICFQDNKTVSIGGTMGNYYSNPSLQWQQSSDSGLTWTDIPGATSATYSRVFSVADTFLFRLSGGDASTIANTNCRVISNSVKVEVDGLPVGYIFNSNSPLCSGQDLIFNITGGASYFMTGPNGFYDDSPFPHIFNSTLADSGMYYVDIKSLGGCHRKDSTHVTMIGTDVHAYPGDTGICVGRSVQLNASIGKTYQWTPAYGLSNTTIYNPIASPEITTAYTVKVSDKDGCSDTAQLIVRVLNKKVVKAMMDATGYMCRFYDSAFFKDISLGTIVHRSWVFGNGNTDTTVTPPVQYYSIPASQQSYNVKLVVTDTAGCADSTFHVIKVQGNCNIAVPSAFTPNGDGRNDFLYPLNAFKATNLVFRVFDRYGQMVFETREWTNKWDGTVNGKPQPTGTYAWILSYIDASGRKVAINGTTVLIR